MSIVLKTGDRLTLSLRRFTGYLPVPGVPQSCPGKSNTKTIDNRSLTTDHAKFATEKRL